MESTQTIITVCAWCNRERIGLLAWQPVEAQAGQQANSTTVTHTICPECKAKQLRQLAGQPVMP